MKILIIGPSWVGDMVMSQCLYTEIKKLHPEAIIDIMAPGWCKPVLERMPEVNQAIEMPLGHGDLNLLARYQLGKILRDDQYDHAYILPNSAKSALVPFFAKIPVRTGWKGEMRYGLLNDLRNNKKAFNLMIERYIALAHPTKNMTGSGCLTNMPYPKLTIDTVAQKEALNKFGLSSDRVAIGLCPGAEFGPAKRWPEQHFAVTAKTLIEQGHQVWLFGSAKDREVTDKIKNSLPAELQAFCYNLAGNTSLIEAIDLLAACKIVVSNDSGLMHVSAAVGCHIVALYGSTTPSYTPPLAEHVEVLHTDISCRPCFKRECPLGHLKCLTELTPDLVINAIDKLKKV
ncbi:lipopolysaccharide heptosyltransferase II [Photobacterium damselae subsp. damselae]|uniref:lipopolysaccharide heptosyltransferase II n=1 Tax=Photobacterium damselae TaxID=38293 RepID=UPI001EEF1E2F|nr:lipopolysaccharide heptosyltransferase II [Photobacterium damselae]UJZ94014.1 lipopolysaccharide heptosyltransferase II [Photobacterium damselae subsp. damselae]UJZ97995.1 lipopolysaccharide heptosyltransferase II [Photobacterium damselae subsp. damselae]